MPAARGQAIPGGSPRATRKLGGRRELTEDHEKIEAFIRQKGVTKCPGMGTKELAALNMKRDEEYRAMTQQEKRFALGLAKRKRGRPATMTPEQKKQKQLEYARSYYAANREKKAVYDRERREQKHQAKQQGASLLSP